MRKFLILLFLIFAVACKKSFGDKLREKTDKYLFKEAKDADKRTKLQAGTRDFVHGVYHTGSGIAKYMKGKKEEAKQDFQRAKDHFSGENLKQIKRRGSGGGHKF